MARRQAAVGSAAGRCRAGDSTRSRLILTQPLKDKYFPSLGFEDRWFVWEVIAEDTGGGRESEKVGEDAVVKGTAVADTAHFFFSSRGSLLDF